MDLLIKMFAALAMVADHFAITHLNASSPEFFILRGIGRAAYPIFSALIIYNFLFRTSSKENMLIRILLFAGISQPVFSIVLHAEHLNILFSFFFVLLGIYMLENKMNLLFVLYFFLMYAADGMYDYGFAGFLWGYFVYLYYKMKNPLPLILGALALFQANSWIIFESFENRVTSIGVFGNAAGILAGIATAFLLSAGFFGSIDIRKKKNVKPLFFTLQKFSFYLFYPLHILALGIF